MNDQIQKAGENTDLSQIIFCWISPEGEIYPCGWLEHETIADKLCESHGYKLDKEWNRYGDELIRRKWIKFARWGFAYEMSLLDMSQSQINACFDLARAASEAGREEIMEAFKGMIGVHDESHLEGSE